MWAHIVGTDLGTARQPVTDAGAYGFAFDDVRDHASPIEDGAPTSMTVTATAF